MLAPALAFTSNLFRLASWVFLRIIPVRGFRTALPMLYALYVLLWTRIPTGHLVVEEDVIAITHEETLIEDEPSSLVPSTTSTGKKNKKRRKVPVTVIDGVVDVVELKETPPSPSLPKPNPLRVLLSLPTSSRGYNWIPLVINTILMAWCLDLLYTPMLFYPYHNLTFSRVGAVTSTSAKILVRLPPHSQPVANAEPIELSSHRLLYRQAKPVGPWLSGPHLKPEEARDFVSTVQLSDLNPGTSYEYILPPAPHNPTPFPLSFETSPDPTLARSTGVHYSFLASSCLKPNFPYSPNPMHHRLRIPGFTALARWLGARSERLPSFFVFMGDWIYADTPNKGTKPKWFTRLNRQVYANEDAREVYEKVPFMHIWDDHEISNNFAGEGNASLHSPYPAAASAYQIYQGDANPWTRSPSVMWYDFDYGDTSFFVMDTRPFRTREDAQDGEDKTMLGSVQKAALMNWLSRTNGTASFKFLVSSVPFTTLWGKPDGQLDTWAGYRVERDEILSVLEYVPNVVVISGDRHEFAAVELRSKVTEFSVSPLSQFYVPYFPTLKQSLSRYLPFPVKTVSQSEYDALLVDEASEGSQVEAMTAAELEKGIPEEVLLKYIPHGNIKWGSFEVDTRNPDQPTVSFELWVDSKLAWQLKIAGVRVQPYPMQETTVGEHIVGGWWHWLEKFGITRRNWF